MRIHVSQALVVDGCTVDARADEAGVVSQTVAGISAGSLTFCVGGHLAAAGAGSDIGLRFYGVRLPDEEFGAESANETLVVDASWLDATGTAGGVACDRGSLVAARFVTPAGGTFGAAGVVDADGAVATHVVIEPEGATAPAGETVTPGDEVPGDGGSTADVDPAIKGVATEQTTHPTVKPAISTKTITTKAVTKTTVVKASNRKTATATSSSLPKTVNSHWIAVSQVLFLLGMALLSAIHRC